MTFRIYIDGQAGTTGLRIREWLAGRPELEVLVVPEAQRRDAGARRAMIETADVTVLCLPDDAAREAAGWARESGARVLDASTAHRVEPGWVYGLPELEPGLRESIRSASRVANPGCYPTGFLLLIRPLVEAGLLPPEAPVSIHALSGYSGGGRSLIERWEDEALGLGELPFEAPYAVERVHKHIPEMARYSGLRRPPQFVPAVGPFRCGMRVQVPVHAALLAPGAGAGDAHGVLEARYAGEPFVRVLPPRTEALGERALDPRACNDTNRIELHVLPNPAGHLLLVAILDNLGKGASGAAVQNLNLMLGLEETRGLPA